MANNDVIIRVRVRQDVKDGFGAVGKEAEAEGERAGQRFTSRFGGVMTRMAALISDPIKRAGQQIGERMGEHTGTSFVQRLATSITTVRSKLTEIGRNIGRTTGDSISREVTESIVRGARDADVRVREVIRASGGAGGRGGDSTSGSRSGGLGRNGGRGGDGGKATVDIDKQSFLARMADLGKSGAAALWGTLSSNLLVLLGGGALLAIIPGIVAPIAAAVVTGVGLALSGGAIALGVIAALKDPRIQGAVGELKTRLSGLFAEFGKPFLGPLENFLVGPEGKSGLVGFIKEITPNFQHLAGVLGPVADKLGAGIIGMLQNMMPGLIDGMENLAPVVEVLAKRLPDIGQALGDFFREMGEHGDDAAIFFNDIITVVLKVIDVVGKLIGFFAGLYGGVRRFAHDATKLILAFVEIVINWFGKLLGAATLAFGWIPGLGGKLRTAQAAFRDARVNINGELSKIKNKTVTIRIKTMGLAMANAAIGVAERIAAMQNAHGGITGSIGQAASGGIRGGLTWVGERGPELMNVAPGSRVYSNGDSKRMAGGGGDDSQFVGIVQVQRTGDSMLDEIFKGIQIRIERRYQGSAQKAFGNARVAA